MYDDKDVQLASAIIISRQATSVQEIQTALQDARNILHPKPTDAEYKKWQTENGLTPTTPEEDNARARRQAENMDEFARRLR